MGLDHRKLPPGRAGGVHAAAVPRAHQGARASLGRLRLRRAEDHRPDLHRSSCVFFYALGGVLVATLTSGLDPLHPAAWWNDADRLPEARALDRAARVPRRRRLMGPAGRALQALHRRAGATTRGREHDPAAAVAGEGAVHQAATSARRSTSPSTSRCSRASSLALVAAVTARRRRPRRHRRDRPDHRPARRPRPARQGALPRRARRAVPAGADLLRLLPVRRHDRRGEAADRDRVVRRGVLEVRPPLRQRDPADGQQHAVAAVEERSSACTTATSPRTCARPSAPSAWRTSAARSSSS